MNIRQLLETETAELLTFLRGVNCQSPYAYEVIETRLGHFKTVTQVIDELLKSSSAELRELQQWFRQESDAVFLESRLVKRARTWPEGYPGDYLTLEAVYANTPAPGAGLGPLLDRYFLSRTLAVAVGSRLRKLADLLNRRAESEEGPAAWLNLACGPGRELLLVPGRESRTVWCVDRDQNALNYAQHLLREAGRAGDRVEFVNGDVFQLARAEDVIARFGRLTTIYSAGLFDYVRTEHLIRLIFIYGKIKLPEETSELGRELYGYTSQAPACRSVRARRDLIASMIDETAARTAHARILSIACGHLREAQLSRAVADGRVGELIGLDYDPASLALVRKEQPSRKIRTVQGSVNGLLAGSQVFTGCDFVYSTGIYDYLAWPTAAELTGLIFRMLKPGGRFLIANFAPNLRDIGYMETFMDWRLIYRDGAELEEVASGLPPDQIGGMRTFRDAHQNLVFLEVVKR
jgi:SAM-dependent methyltransferase